MRNNSYLIYFCLKMRIEWVICGKPVFLNENTFLKSVSTSKSQVTYDLDTDRVTYDFNTDTTMHKIIGVVVSPLYLATPVSTTLPKSHLSM